MELNIGQMQYLEEAKLRGLVMASSADLEMLMLKIILCVISDEPNDPIRKFRTLPLEQKIAMLKHDLKLYKLDLYKKHIKSIRQLEKIKSFRNKLAHCKIEWNMKDTSYFNILIITDVKGKEKPQLIKMAYDEYYKKLKQIRSVIMDLLDLCRNIETEFNQKYPDLIKLGIVT